MENLLDKVRYHWHCYVARGGFEEALTTVGRLEEGGIEHWSAFLSAGRTYLAATKDGEKQLMGFVPSGAIKLLSGA